jgi:hypothetical protein
MRAENGKHSDDFLQRNIKNSKPASATKNIAEIDRFVGTTGSIVLGLGLPFVSQLMFALCAEYQCDGCTLARIHACAR